MSNRDDKVKILDRLALVIVTVIIFGIIILSGYK